jgi:hypothetical protein
VGQLDAAAFHSNVLVERRLLQTLQRQLHPAIGITLDLDPFLLGKSGAGAWGGYVRRLDSMNMVPATAVCSWNPNGSIVAAGRLLNLLKGSLT